MRFVRKKNNKKKKKNVDEYQSEVRLRMPKKDENEVFAVVTLLTGAEYIKVLTEEGEELAARIPGKMRNKVFIKENDLVIVRKWDTGEKKGDVVWRYLPFQVNILKKEGKLNENLPI